MLARRCFPFCRFQSIAVVSTIDLDDLVRTRHSRVASLLLKPPPSQDMPLCPPSSGSLSCGSSVLLSFHPSWTSRFPLVSETFLWTCSRVSSCVLSHVLLIWCTRSHKHRNLVLSFPLPFYSSCPSPRKAFIVHLKTNSKGRVCV